MKLLLRANTKARTLPDVSRDEAGVWHIKAGTGVRVKLTMVAEAALSMWPWSIRCLPGWRSSILIWVRSIRHAARRAALEMRYGWWWWMPWYEH